MFGTKRVHKTTSTHTSAFVFKPRLPVPHQVDEVGVVVGHHVVGVTQTQVVQVRLHLRERLHLGKQRLTIS